MLSTSRKRNPVHFSFSSPLHSVNLSIPMHCSFWTRNDKIWHLCNISPFLTPSPLPLAHTDLKHQQLVLIFLEISLPSSPRKECHEVHYFSLFLSLHKNHYTNTHTQTHTLFWSQFLPYDLDSIHSKLDVIQLCSHVISSFLPFHCVKLKILRMAWKILQVTCQLTTTPAPAGSCSLSLHSDTVLTSTLLPVTYLLFILHPCPSLFRSSWLMLPNLNDPMILRPWTCH